MSDSVAKAVISQYKCILDYYIVHFKYIRFLFVNYTSVKGRIKEKLAISYSTPKVIIIKIAITCRVPASNQA